MALAFAAKKNRVNKALAPRIALTLTILMWGCSFVAAKIALREISPVTLTFCRFAFGTALTPLHTLIVDLTLSDEDLLAQMLAKGRYNLGLARRHGVRVVQSTEMRDLARFYSLFADTAERNDFFSEPFGFFLIFSTRSETNINLARPR